MNIKKAQKDVFNQILNGAKAGFFHVDKNNVLVSAGGYMGYIFPTKKIRFSLDGLREITPFPIAELVKPENRMAPTENYRTTQHGMCRWMKHTNGNYVLVLIATMLVWVILIIVKDIIELWREIKE